MKKYILFVLFVLLSAFCGSKAADIETGDIIFHTSQSNQSKAIKLATHSKYTHLGIIIKKGNKLMVFHAVNPVKFTPLSEWVKDGEAGHYVIKRSKKTFSRADLAALDAAMKKMSGKPYDKYFGWADDKIYCSELVWKLYKEVLSYELCSLRKLKDFDLSAPLVKKMMKERYGDKIPYDEPVVAPSDIFESKELYLIKEM